MRQGMVLTNSMSTRCEFAQRRDRIKQNWLKATRSKKHGN